MLMATLLALAAIVGGTLATYLYDEDAQPFVRVCMGAVTGFAALGLAGFLFASLLGMTPLALVLAVAVVLTPLLLLRKERARVQEDWEAARDSVLRPAGGAPAVFVFYAVTAVLLWLLFDRVLVETAAGGWATGVTNNYGDLPFHLGVITSFVDGNNFPPQD